jgi:nitrite reductase/ring-hydroxylating ferredoxin subunit
MSDVNNAAATRTPGSDGVMTPKHSLVSREYAELERERLWPRVWQVACREEELPKVGSFVTYDILDDSIIVVRTAPDQIKAFNNACLHRGRRLTEGCGHRTRFVCKFHGWAWKIDGTNDLVMDREDWSGRLRDQDLRLTEFKVATWGGFVFINMDPNCEPLETFLQPIPRFLDAYEFQKQRYRWYLSVEVAANWKTCQAAFQESYHVATTHAQIEPFMDSRSLTLGHGRHGQMRYMPAAETIVGRHRDGRPPADGRAAVLELIRQTVRDIESIQSDRDLQAASRILTEMPPNTTYNEAAAKAMQFVREAAIASGAGFPDVTDQQIWEAGYDWSIFPNTVNVISATGGLWYRTRPTPDNDPDKCLFEMYALERFTPGSEPELKKRYYKDWRDCPDMPKFLIGDFQNIPEIQKGLKTRGYRGMRYNPLQEVPIINFHRALDEFMAS